MQTTPTTEIMTNFIGFELGQKDKHFSFKSEITSVHCTCTLFYFPTKCYKKVLQNHVVKV